MIYTFKKALFLTASFAIIGMSVPHSADARERGHSGTYQNSRGHSGTFQSHATTSKGSVTKDGSWTNQKGTGTFNAQKTRKDDKSGWTAHKEATNPNGKTLTVDRDVTKTDTGYSSSGTFTNSNGKTITTSSDITKTADGRVVNTTATNAAGATATRDATVVRQDGVMTKNVSQTGFNGKLREWQKTKQYNK